MAEERLPADIFEEMAGVREITPEPSEISEDNVNQEIIKTEIDEGRLTEASKHLLKKVPEFQQYLVKLAKKLFSFQKKEAKPIKPSPVIVKIPNYKKKKENSEAKAIAKLWDSVIKPIIIRFSIYYISNS